VVLFIQSPRIAAEYAQLTNSVIGVSGRTLVFNLLLCVILPLSEKMRVLSYSTKKFLGENGILTLTIITIQCHFVAAANAKLIAFS